MKVHKFTGGYPRILGEGVCEFGELGFTLLYFFAFFFLTDFFFSL